MDAPQVPQSVTDFAAKYPVLWSLAGTTARIVVLALPQIIHARLHISQDIADAVTGIIATWLAIEFQWRLKHDAAQGGATANTTPVQPQDNSKAGE